MKEKLKPFQRAFMRAVENPAYDTCVLSGPRSLGKTYIAGRILARCMTPGDKLHQPGKEYILGAATLDTARMTYAFIRAELEEPTGEYRFIDSTTRLGITHVKTNTKLRVISSNAKSSFGLVNVPLAVIDEPGALEIVGGQMLADSMFTAQGKVGSRLKVVMIGTLAPMATRKGHWWYDLVHGGTRGRTYGQFYEGDIETWDNWHTIRKANPLVMLDAHTRKVILEERDEARADTRLKARFLSYRLNIPSADESQVLLTLDDFQRCQERDVGERKGAPIVGADLGAGRAWSAACAVYRSGRVEAIAVCPGIPSIEEQEKRDGVSAGTYQMLVDDGTLRVADGLRVQPPRMLWDAIYEKWGRPTRIVCDRVRLHEFKDAVKGAARIEAGVSRWSEASYDIRALRRLAKDGPLSVDEQSRLLIAASLSVAVVKNDEQGNVRLVKGGSNNQGRDDVAEALKLGAGAYARALERPRKRRLSAGTAR